MHDSVPGGIIFKCRSYFCFFVFKQRTAYDMRISDWSSDGCSPDLQPRGGDVEALVDRDKSAWQCPMSCLRRLVAPHQQRRQPPAVNAEQHEIDSDRRAIIGRRIIVAEEFGIATYIHMAL